MKQSKATIIGLSAAASIALGAYVIWQQQQKANDERMGQFCAELSKHRNDPENKTLDALQRRILLRKLNECIEWMRGTS